MFKKILGYVLAPITALLVMVGSAQAALPAGVTTAIDTATTDGTTLGYAFLAMAVVVGVIFWLKGKAH
ncbi:hypothetical protein GALL_269480 [mine drainage metagenome]|uniref:Uncharacterized protein n=1 Tax=mine drainage metagenome TaxID=410659 RepID=A0A1J5RGN4_9ZZZZ